MPPPMIAVFNRSTPLHHFRAVALAAAFEPAELSRQRNQLPAGLGSTQEAEDWCDSSHSIRADAEAWIKAPGQLCSGGRCDVGDSAAAFEAVCFCARARAAQVPQRGCRAASIAELRHSFPCP